MRKLPKAPLPNNVTVIVTYQNKPLTLRYFNEHPEIHHMYLPAKDFVSLIYAPLLAKGRASNTKQVVEVSENQVLINGLVFNGTID